MLRNSTALTMAIPRNGCNSNISLSPEMRQETPAATANSRNLLSLGSRQTVMVSTGENCLTLFFISFKSSISFIICNKIAVEYFSKDHFLKFIQCFRRKSDFSIQNSSFYCLPIYRINQKRSTYQSIGIKNEIFNHRF